MDKIKSSHNADYVQLLGFLVLAFCVSFLSGCCCPVVKYFLSDKPSSAASCSSCSARQL